LKIFFVTVNIFPQEIDSSKGMLVNKLSTSNETINLFEVRRLVTFSFVNKITNLRTSNKFMVSFDVESLFTNIPLLESIELAVDYILSGNPNIKLNKDSLKELFLVATAQTHFLF